MRARPRPKTLRAAAPKARRSRCFLVVSTTPIPASTATLPVPVAPISAFHKIAKRRFDDISSVAIAFALRLEGDTVADIKIGLGGVAAMPIRASATEAAPVRLPVG